MADFIEWEITDDELANYPRYSWPLRCCWCGSGMGLWVKAHDVDGMSFGCPTCGKPNRVSRVGKRIRVSRGAKIPVGSLVMLGIVIASLSGVAIRLIRDPSKRITETNGAAMTGTGMMGRLTLFSAEHHRIFWFVIGALIITALQVRSIGWSKFRASNHPIQALLFLIVAGGCAGLLMAWIANALCH